MRMIVACALFSSVLAASVPAVAQHTTVGAAPSHPLGPFEVKVDGHYQTMMRHRDYSAKIGIAASAQSMDGYGVGALADRAGELTVVAGKPFISLGGKTDGAVEAQVPDNAQAALLVAGKVAQWLDIPIARDLNQADFEAFVVAEAAKAGIQADTPFPFLVRGAIKDYAWHVIARNDSDFVAEGQMAKGELVGFYAGTRLAGIATHPGEFFHVHYLDDGLAHGGHVDRYGVVAGSVLLLPKQGR